MPDKHFSSQFETELQVVTHQLMELGRQLDDQVSQMMEALSHFDAESARRALDVEEKVNVLEVDTDHEITSIIARRQPVARDLRLLLAISKASGCLERVGVEADKMSHKVLKLTRSTAMRISTPRELQDLTGVTTGLLRAALAAFARHDLAGAMVVIKDHHAVYAGVDALIHRLVGDMMQSPRAISVGVELISLTKSHELIADHAKHIAELVLYVVNGTDVHQAAVAQTQSTPDDV